MANATARIGIGLGNQLIDREYGPVVIPQRKGDPKVVDTDECPRETTPEILAGLKPVFKKDGGVVTAGNASAISDGASAVVVTSRKKAAELGLKPIAQLVSYATAACEPAIMGYGETLAAQYALEKAGLTSKDVQLAELNEAFAARGLAIGERGLDPDISTSTAARSLSATRSATPGRACWSRSSTSS